MRGGWASSTHTNDIPNAPGCSNLAFTTADADLPVCEVGIGGADTVDRDVDEARCDAVDRSACTCSLGAGSGAGDRLSSSSDALNVIDIGRPLPLIKDSTSL